MPGLPSPYARTLCGFPTLVPKLKEASLLSVRSSSCAAVVNIYRCIQHCSGGAISCPGHAYLRRELGHSLGYWRWRLDVVRAACRGQLREGKVLHLLYRFIEIQYLGWPELLPTMVFGEQRKRH
jgi:hypothetical protein